MEESGKKFIETFGQLPNILKEIDRLEAEGKYWREFIGGGPDHLFRVLIISKLCNVPNYQKKLERIKPAFENGLPDWRPYWEKLLTKLETLKPIYNC